LSGRQDGLARWVRFDERLRDAPRPDRRRLPFPDLRRLVAAAVEAVAEPDRRFERPVFALGHGGLDDGGLDGPALEAPPEQSHRQGTAVVQEDRHQQQERDSGEGDERTGHTAGSGPAEKALVILARTGDGT